MIFRCLKASQFCKAEGLLGYSSRRPRRGFIENTCIVPTVTEPFDKMCLPYIPLSLLASVRSASLPCIPRRLFENWYPLPIILRRVSGRNWLGVPCFRLGVFRVEPLSLEPFRFRHRGCKTTALPLDARSIQDSII